MDELHEEDLEREMARPRLEERLRLRYIEAYGAHSIRAFADIQKEIAGKIRRIAGLAFVEGDDDMARYAREVADGVVEDRLDVQLSGLMETP